MFPLTGVLVVRGERRPVELLPRTAEDDPRFAVHAPPGRRFESGLAYHECDDTDDVLTWGAVPTEPDDDATHQRIREKIRKLPPGWSVTGYVCTNLKRTRAST